MENALYIGLSRQVTLGRQMNLVANNIANINTPGYRADKMLFEQFLSQPRPDKDEIALVMDYGQYKVEEQGPLQYTGKTLDVAIEGPGYIPVDTAAGQQYTRAGNFTLNNFRELVTPSGNHVLDNGGNIIVIAEGAQDIRITSDGQISTNNGVVGIIGLQEFENVQSLIPVGNGFYRSDEIPRPAQNSTFKQGMLEGSNVKGVLEMSDMIDVSRTYQSISRMLDSENERQRNVIQTLTDSGR